VGPSVVTLVSLVFVISKVKEHCRLLRKDYKYSVLSQDAILKYNAHYSKRWNFEALHSYFNEVTIAFRQAAQHSMFIVSIAWSWEIMDQHLGSCCLACAHAVTVYSTLHVHLLDAHILVCHDFPLCTMWCAFKVAQTVIFLWEAWALTCTSVLGIMRSPKGSRESAQGFKFAKLTTNKTAQGLLRKPLFPPSLVSCLQYHLFYLRKHPSVNFK